MFDNLTLVSRFEKPVLYPGQNYQWDAFDVHSHYTIFDSYSKWYRIYYSNTTKALGQKSAIGLAFSENGLDRFVSDAWVNPLLKGGGMRAWDRWLWKCRVMCLAKKDWRMWYGGFNVKGLFAKKRLIGVGYATSRDGWDWEKHEANPIIMKDENKPNWWDGLIYDFTPVKVGNSFKALYYSGKGQCIGLMESKDGIDWEEEYCYPVLKPMHDNWESHWNGWKDGAISPKWLGKIGDVFVLAYEAGPTGKYSVGLAYSKDLIHWQRDKRNPILKPRQGFFDSKFVADPSLVISGKEMRVYYGAEDKRGLGYVGLAIFSFEN